MAHDVFISYSSKDKAVADAVCASLEARKIRCWIAPRDVLPGQTYAEALIDALNSSRLMVLVFSASANDSPQVVREVERAVNKSIPILPFRIEEVIPSKSMEYFVSSSHWLDAMTPPLEHHLQRLGDTVDLLLNKGTEALPPTEYHPPAPATAPRASSQKKLIPLYIAGGCILIILVIVGTLFFSGRLGRRFFGAEPGTPPAIHTPAPPTHPPDTGAQPAGTAGPAFQDDFASTSSGWTRISDDIKDADYINGEYSLTVKKIDTMVPIVNRNAGLFRDMRMEVDARLTGSAAENLYGLVFREQDVNNYYAFALSGDGSYMLQKRVNGVFSPVIKKATSPVIKKDGSYNRLEVVCRGSQIEVLCNGTHLADAVDKSFAEGWVGVIVHATSPPATAVFDNFDVYKY